MTYMGKNKTMDDVHYKQCTEKSLHLARRHARECDTSSGSALFAEIKTIYRDSEVHLDVYTV